MASRCSRLIPRSIVVAFSLLLLPTLTIPAATLTSTGVSSQSGIVALRNANWDVVKVEVRLGASSDCDLYPSVAIRTLKRGESWAIVAAGVVCWRREALPGAQQLVWTTWHASALPAMGVVDVTL